MDIQESRDHITAYAKCIIDESTFFLLDETTPVWIASVTTTPNPELGEPTTFIAFVTGTHYRIIEPEWVPDLACWFSSLITGNNLSGSTGNYQYARPTLSEKGR